MDIDLPLLFFNGSQRLGHDRQDVFSAKSPVRNSFGNCAPVLSMMRLGHYASLHNAFLLGLEAKNEQYIHDYINTEDLFSFTAPIRQTLTQNAKFSKILLVLILTP